MKILFTSPIIEHPAAGGPQLRIENSIKALNDLSELHILARVNTRKDLTDGAVSFFSSISKKFIVTYGVCNKFDGYSFLDKVVRRLVSYTNLKEKLDAEYIVKYTDKNNIDLVWFGYGNISYQLIKEVKKRRPSLKLVCDTDSVWSRFVLRELPYSKGIRKLRIRYNGWKKQLEEKEWVRVCDVTTAVSDVDSDFYKSLTVDKNKIHVFSNVIDLNTYDSFRNDSSQNAKRPSIYLAGSYGHYHSAMDMATRWVLEEVLPILLNELPDLHFYIVGRNSDVGFGHLSGANITVTGKVDSVLPILFNVDVALVPLKFESGTRYKILEAGACRIPIVSTTLGAEGIPVLDNEHVLIADEPSDFAAAILKIIKNKDFSSHLSTNCRLLIEQSYSIESLKKEARAILNFIAK